MGMVWEETVVANISGGKGSLSLNSLPPALYLCIYVLKKLFPACGSAAGLPQAELQL